VTPGLGKTTVGVAWLCKDTRLWRNHCSQWPGSVGATKKGEAILGPWPSSSEARRPERGHCGDGLVALRPGRAPVEWLPGGIYGLRRGSTPPCN
jgi:hypothetical protein